MPSPEQSKNDRINDSVLEIRSRISGNNPVVSRMADALAELHYADEAGMCAECATEWPCRTIQAMTNVRARPPRNIRSARERAGYGPDEYPQ